MPKTIEFTLDSDSVSKAIKEVEAYAEWIREKLSELARILTEEESISIAAVEIAALGAVDTGELSDSIYGFYDAESHVGIVGSKAPYAFYVEYGTGIVAARGAAHPEMGGDWAPAPSQYTGYDTNNHGDAGWYYISERDGKLHWTKGTEARPFMYGTFVELERKSRQLAKELFNR